MANNRKNIRNPEKSDSGKKLPENIVRALAQSEGYKIKGENTKALRVAEKILIKDPSCVQAAEEIADNLLSLGKDKEAEKAAKFAYSLNEKSYIANYIIGFTGLDDNPDAVKHLKIANEACPNNPEILRCLGWGLFHLGHEAEGIATLDRALNIRHDDPLILCDLGVCLLHQNLHEKAVKLFEKALSLEPNNIRAIECYEAAKNIQDEMDAEFNKLPPEVKKLITAELQKTKEV